MNLLALDTSTRSCVIGVARGDELIERSERVDRTHSQVVLPMIQETLASAGLTLGELDALVLGQGPGSFTGLRIAAGVIQGLAFGLNLRVAPVSTLAALAQARIRRHGDDHIAVAMHARVDEMFFGCYSNHEGLAASEYDEGVVVLDDLDIDWARYSGTGDGWAQASASTTRDRLLGYDTAAVPSASDLLTLGRQLISEDRTVVAAEALPRYLRETVATPAANQKKPT